MERLLDSVLRGLRYRELRRVVGRPVRVESSGSIAADLCRELDRELPEGLTVYGPPCEEYLPTQVARYGLMDLIFSSRRPLLDDPGDAAGLCLLDKLGFLPSRFHLESFPGEPDPTGLSCLVEEMQEGLSFVRVLLTSPHPAPGSDPASGAALFPREFVVQDACIANASSVWLHKHFYL